ncbi:hypothetical protein NP493_184g02016 [Ridgeia piscesae]|uniref:Uncharacterized protein n=1 Tax=Ridgeia piscesae TaxID=27915 RepID=A0AAD9P2H9_RIDPI|nr:hypothetical protein NP493_184g02016 [Ridgeia piscesae]
MLTLHNKIPNSNRLNQPQLLKVRKIIMSSPSKSCDIDPLPTILLKACLDVLIRPITYIINASLRSGLFPEDFKRVHVNPVLKKTTLLRKN